MREVIRWAESRNPAITTGPIHDFVEWLDRETGVCHTENAPIEDAAQEWLDAIRRLDLKS